MRTKAALLALLPALAVSGCARPTPPPAAAPRLAAPDGGWVARTLKKMTVEEKIGQMIACRFTAEFRNADSPALREIESLVVDSKIGGLILFAPARVYETAELANGFQKLAKVPLLMAADFEAGAAFRVSATTPFPPLMALGAAGSEDIAYEMGRITALEGRAIGIHMTYAPVVDVNINPDNPIINTRSVGADPALVSRIAKAFIRGAQANGMLATAKHFPGHGDTGSGFAQPDADRHRRPGAPGEGRALPLQGGHRRRGQGRHDGPSGRPRPRSLRGSRPPCRPRS